MHDNHKFLILRRNEPYVWNPNFIQKYKSTDTFEPQINKVGPTLSFDDNKLYDDHIPLSRIQRTLLSIGSSLMAIYDPYRHDMVATFGETSGHNALRKMYSKMLNNPEGLQILHDRPRISSETIDIDALGKLPTNTFGYAYYRFLVDNRVSPDTRKEVRFVDDVELAYVMQRYREVHDLVHTLLGMPTNMLGEVLVKWVEGIQHDLPMCWLGGLFGPIRLKTRKARDFYTKQGLQWALQCGHQANDLLSVYYEKRFNQDLNELRNELNIPTPPKF
ncbi:Ubiquinone biosynthesis protein [Blomia tropicalis]|nr:Ubiquinone biosynthesis protein [Blomia tropicalis]